MSARSNVLPSEASIIVPVAGSKFASRLSFSIGGVAYSYRTPRFSVSDGESLKSSWRNTECMFCP